MISSFLFTVEEISEGVLHLLLEILSAIIKTKINKDNSRQIRIVVFSFFGGVIILFPILRSELNLLKHY